MMDQHVVLVTGSSSGFGRLTVETLARRGKRVFASMRGIAGKNAAARAEIEAVAQKETLAVEVVELDVTDDRSVENAIAEIIRRAGRIDVVVNNAGVGCMGITEGFTLAQVRLLFETNFFGAVRVNRAVLPHMRQQGAGLLVHITSVAGRIVFPYLGPYCATKFALEAMAEAFHHDLAPLGVESVLIEPGVYHTSIGANAFRAEDTQRLEEYGALQEKVKETGRTFQGYVAPDPQEVADAVADVIAVAPGRRPLRTLVGPDAKFAGRLNQLATQVQEQELRYLGLGDGTSQ